MEINNHVQLAEVERATGAAVGGALSASECRARAMHVQLMDKLDRLRLALESLVSATYDING